MNLTQTRSVIRAGGRRGDAPTDGWAAPDDPTTPPEPGWGLPIPSSPSGSLGSGGARAKEFLQPPCGQEHHDRELDLQPRLHQGIGRLAFGGHRPRHSR
jgi:hypothetical protein